VVRLYSSDSSFDSEYDVVSESALNSLKLSDSSGLCEVLVEREMTKSPPRSRRSRVDRLYEVRGEKMSMNLFTGFLIKGSVVNGLI